MTAPTITYIGFDGASHTLPIGRDHSVNREGACLDICLHRAVAPDCPLVVQILVRTTGEIVFWASEWRQGAENTYWHFSAGTDAGKTLTDPQRDSLELMWLGRAALPGNLGGALGQPVARWAFAGTTPDEIADRHAAPRVVLNG